MLAWFRSKTRSREQGFETNNSDGKISDLCGTFSALVLMDDAVGMRRLLESASQSVRTQLCNSRHLSTCPPLFMCSKRECVGILLEFGANVNRTDSETGNTIIHLLGGACEGTEEFERLRTCLQFCRARGIWILNVRNKDGETVLDHAFRRSLETCDPSAFLGICDAIYPEHMDKWFANNTDWFTRLSQKLQLTELDSAT